MTYDDFIETIIMDRGQWSDIVRESTCGCERHLIVPKCLCGEPKSLTWAKHKNIIWLYPREHFIAHKLLIEKYPNNIKIKRAYTMMLPKGKSGKRDFITPEEYEELRTIYSQINKGENNPAKRPAVREKISKSSDHRGSKNPRYGVKLSDDLKQLISVKTKEAMSSNEIREKIRQTRKQYNVGCKWYNNGDKEVFRKECPDGYTVGRLKRGC